MGILGLASNRIFPSVFQRTAAAGKPPPSVSVGDDMVVPGNPDANIPTTQDFPDPGTAGTPIGGTGNVVPSAPPSGTMTGDAGDFLRSLYAARPAFLLQQQDLLQQLGPGLRDAAFAASPELAAVSGYLMKSFEDPYGGMLATYQDAIRGAQAARGFGGGGTGLTGEEARYLTGFAEKRRQEMLPQLQAFGNNLLQIGGLQAPPDITLSAVGSLALQNRLQQDTKAAGEAQSEWAQKIYEEYMKSQNPFGTPPPNPFGSKNPIYTGGAPQANPYGVGMGSSVYVGSNTGYGAGQDWYSKNASQAAGYGNTPVPSTPTPYSSGGGGSSAPQIGAPASTGYQGPYFNSSGDLVNSEGVPYNVPSTGDPTADALNKKAAADYAAGAASGVITPQYADWAIQHLGLSTF